MKVPTSSAALLAFLATGLASPTPAWPTLRGKYMLSRNTTTAHLYICQEPGFEAPCENLHAEVGKCYNVTEENAGKISSAGPDKGSFCALYPQPECQGVTLPITYPGVRNLARYEFNDLVSSYRCDFIAGFSGA